MDIEKVLQHSSAEKLPVLAALDERGQPEAALAGFAVTAEMNIILIRVKSSRKYPNLKKNPRVACVAGYPTEVTVPCGGMAEGLAEDELTKYRQIHFCEVSGRPGAGKLGGHNVF